ncbi:MAG: adenylyl-sulfate kinase [Methylophilaceae bacterium]|jgi:adenylylsulfate kinase|nr:adenylyl-sulfate kinase [Methylophilaceae bacterium]
MTKSNKFEQVYKITKLDRSLKKKQKPLCIWFTGLSGSGKSTLIDALEIYLYKKNFHTYVLDGDNLRNGLCGDLDFSNDSRDENLRRASEVARLMVDAGLIVLAGFISPSLKQRERIRRLFNKNEFIEVFVSTPLDICEKRDVKGLYEKARIGKIKNFTGVDSEFEVPDKSEITIDTQSSSIDQSMVELIGQLKL